MKAILATIVFTYFISSIALGQIKMLGDELKLVTTTVTTKEGKSFILKLVTSSGKVAQKIATKPTPKSVLDTYLPSKVSKMMKAQGTKMAAGGAFVKNVMVQKMFRFPVETTGFFAALGAVMTYELAFNYANNPVAYEQLYQSQLDPVGQLGFYFFMVGNGVAAEPLMNLIQQGKLNRKFAPFIPFFGMGVGSVASNIVHELGHSPNLWACARGLISGKGLDAKSCDQAARSWNERGGAAGIASEWTPTIVALSGSIILSGVAKSGLGIIGKGALAAAIVVRNGVIHTTAKIFGKATLRAVVTMSAMMIVTNALPGGIYVKGLLKAAAFVGELALFTWIDEVTRRPIIFAYQNLAKGGWLRKSYDEIQSVTNSMNKSKWSAVVTQGYVDDIREFGKVMSQWRQVNLANVLESQANWEQALSKISNTYTASQIFYGDFIDHLWQKKYGRYAQAYADGSETRITDMVFPLFGIKPSDLNVKPETIYLSAPDTIERAQLMTVQNVIESIDNGKLISKDQIAKMSKSELAKFNSILKKLATLKPLVVGKALVEMDVEIAKDGNARTQGYCPGCPTGSPLQASFSIIIKALGRPDPILIPGLGYARYYEMSEEHSDLVEKVNFKQRFGGFTESINVSTPRFVDSMIASMMVGPDPIKKESSLESNKGFIAVFNPPQITKADASFNVTQAMVSSRGHGTIVNVYESQVSAKDSSGRFHKSAYSYLTNGGIRSDILNEDPQAMNKWWTSRIEPQYVRAWVNFENHYQKNIAKLMQAMKAPQSVTNRYGFLWTRQTNVPNGILASFNFENNLYFEILSNMSRQLAVNQYPQMRYTVTTRTVKAPFWRRGSLPKNPWDILGILGQETSKTEVQKVYKPSQQLFVATAWIGELDSSLRRLNGLTSKIKAAYNVKKSKPKDVLTISFIENEQIQAEVDRAKQALTKASSLLSLKAGHATPLKLAQGQKVLAKVAIQGISKNIQELGQYLLIANAVSYQQRHGDAGKKFISPRCEAMMSAGSQRALGVSYIQRVAGCE